MKKLDKILLLLCAVSFISCGGDNPSVQEVDRRVQVSGMSLKPSEEKINEMLFTGDASIAMGIHRYYQSKSEQFAAYTWLYIAYMLGDEDSLQKLKKFEKLIIDESKDASLKASEKVSSYRFLEKNYYKAFFWSLYSYELEEGGISRSDVKTILCLCLLDYYITDDPLAYGFVSDNLSDLKCTRKRGGP